MSADTVASKVPVPGGVHPHAAPSCDGGDFFDKPIAAGGLKVSRPASQLALVGKPRGGRASSQSRSAVFERRNFAKHLAERVGFEPTNTR